MATLTHVCLPTNVYQHTHSTLTCPHSTHRTHMHTHAHTVTIHTTHTCMNKHTPHLCAHTHAPSTAPGGPHGTHESVVGALEREARRAALAFISALHPMKPGRSRDGLPPTRGPFPRKLASSPTLGAGWGTSSCHPKSLKARLVGGHHPLVPSASDSWQWGICWQGLGCWGRKPGQSQAGRRQGWLSVIYCHLLVRRSSYTPSDTFTQPAGRVWRIGTGGPLV